MGVYTVKRKPSKAKHTDGEPKEITARYESYCGSCGTSLRKGDRIVWWIGTSRVRCVGCTGGSKAYTPRRTIFHSEQGWV